MKIRRSTYVAADGGAKTTLDQVANPDLLAGIGKQRGSKKTPLLVGFAAETQDVIANAQRKLASKKCDLIVANDVSEPDAGFGVYTNRVTLVDASGTFDLPAGPKSFVAHGILDRGAALLSAPRTRPSTSHERAGADDHSASL